MLCILEYKGAIDDTLTSAENEEDSSNLKDNEKPISPIHSDTDNYYYFSSTPLAVYQTMIPLSDLIDRHANLTSIK